MPAVAIVRTPVAPLHAEPRVSSAQATQALFGRLVLVLGADGDWRRVRTLHDGYEGWAHRGYLDEIEVPALPDDEAIFGAYEARTFEVPAVRTASPDVTSPDGARDAAREAFGEQVPSVSLGCTVQAGARRLRLPLGAVVHAEQALVDGEAVRIDEKDAHYPVDAAAICASAERLFAGTSYQWGGVTPWGADCSGFVQTLLGLHGVDLPRDAWQQARVGVAGDADPLAARPADLLFFSERDDRRPTHVGLALGGGRMAHLALGRGGWAVDDLGDGDDAYVAELRGRFVGARRVV